MCTMCGEAYDKGGCGGGCGDICDGCGDWVDVGGGGGYGQEKNHQNQQITPPFRHLINLLLITTAFITADVKLPLPSPNSTHKN